MSFINNLKSFNTDEFNYVINCTDKGEIHDILLKERIGYSDFLKLLSKEAGVILEDLAVVARHQTIQRFGKIINFYIPVYLSNECTNNCIYCGFNKNTDITRKTLSIDEIKEEYKKLKDMGFDNVLLLTGESPETAGIDYIEEAVNLARDYFTFIGLEVYPMEIEDYHRLVDAGASGITIYQETYDRDVYDLMHRSGRKKDFLWRLNTPERAAKAGFRKIGMGSLLGLSDWRFEAAMLALHIDYLHKRFWREEVTLGFPRINPPSSDFNIPNPVSSRELVQMMCALRIFLPDTPFLLTTRESPDLRNNLIGLCVTQISAGSKTNPGGYLNDRAGKQFCVNDNRDLLEMIDLVKSKGYEAVLKDWEVYFTGISK